MAHHAIFLWDFTLWSEIDHTLVIKALREIGKKWSFQQERSAEGRLHYQGKVSLHKRKRFNEMLALVRPTPLCSAHWSPSSTNSGASFSYVTKLDTRAAGPWHDTDEPVEPFIMPDDIKEIAMLRPWQTAVTTWALWPIYERRKIAVIVDLIGGIGKTTMKRWLQCNHRDHVQVIPPLSDPKDMAQFIMSTRRPNIRCYIVDIPRACTDPKVLARLYGGLETIKDGSCYDTRYKGREMVFTPPRVLVFTNTIPDIKWMSKDRWIATQVEETNTGHHLQWLPNFPIHSQTPLAVDYKLEASAGLQTTANTPSPTGGGFTPSGGLQPH